MTDKVRRSLVALCTDICRRHGKKRLIWIEDKNTVFKYALERNEMMVTVHRWFADKECPGQWLYERLGLLAETVSRELAKANYMSSETSDGFL